MKNKLTNIVLLIVVFAIALVLYSCDKNNGDSDDLYHVTTNSFAHNYYKPKKANLFGWKDNVIIGDWYSNEKIPYAYQYQDLYNGRLSKSETDDFAEEYAEHYCFMTQDNLGKYVENGKVMVDLNDIISPFKEYAAYYADTTYLTNHNCFLMGISGHENLCVLPLIGIDVVCNKDYDEEHPAGSKLNDILFYDQDLDTYGYLQSKEYQGDALESGIGHIKDFEMRRINLLAENPV